ncbi:MAG: hypothetical protein JWQ09_1478 [Segetibacter sp.]|nr:hypothetical protein [Segetibacter sp.]
MIAKEGRSVLQLSWSEAWTSMAFRRKLIAGWILYIAVLLYYPHFFASIQKKEGILLNDFVLAFLPSVNMSATIFSFIYITVIVAIYRAAQSPYLFLLYLWATLILSVSRIITISCVPLEPPLGLVSLVDPVLLPFYGPNAITKDLFYSGHMASVFLAYLILKRNREKMAALIATIVVGVCLLFQHIHYTIDVLAAPLFVYFFFVIAKKITGFTGK